jgi:DNA replication protein DnaC
MQTIQSLLNYQVGLNPTKEVEVKSKVEILKNIFTGKATEEERQLYRDNYMCDEEKQIGKPFFEMDEQEKKQYNVLTYNNSEGDLDKYNCPICKNRGDIMYINKDGYEVYQTCTCWNIRKTIKRMEDCGLGNLLSIYTFDKYKCDEQWQKDTYETAKAFVTSNYNWFCMLGQSGSGKSHICTAISRELLKQGMDLKYMMWIDDVTVLNQCVNDGDKYGKLISEYKNAQVLYIDDFFKSENDTKPSPAEIKRANEILNYRYNKARMDKTKRWTTIISSERTLEQLLSYDQALAGRIVEMTKPNNLILLSGMEKNYRLR